MTVRESEPESLHDPLEWLTALLQKQWKHPRVERPEIGPRREFASVKVKDADFVLLYHAGENPHTPRGPRHYRDSLLISFDIRTEQRVIALAIRDEVKRILERALALPDPHSEWDQILVESIAYPSDFFDYTQIVIDARLSKFARTKTLPRTLEG